MIIGLAPNISKDLPPIQQQLEFKNAQLKALFGLTQAINENKKQDKLLELYEYIIYDVMGIREMAIYTQYSGWQFTTGYTTKEKYRRLNIRSEIDQLNMWGKLSELNHPFAEDFEYIVPTFHKSHPIAITLLGGSDKINDSNYEESLIYIQTISNIVAVAIENKKFAKEQMKQKAELSFASQTVSALLPSAETLPNNEFIQIVAEYIPDNKIGGDYYDFSEVNEDEIMFCIGDISGKGIAAAVLMSNLQAYMRISIGLQENLKDFITQFNKQVNQVTKGEKFMTLFIGKYNYLSRKLQYINAGHTAPVLMNGNECLTLEKGCTLLGMFDTLPKVEIGTVDIRPGALLLCYTDGIMDLENIAGEQLGDQKIKAFVNNYHELPIKQFKDYLLEYIITYRGGELFDDDITFMVSRFH